MQKKLLVLGGKPIGSTELVEKARALGYYTIVADYLPKESSHAKQYANEDWLISTGELDMLEALSREAEVDGVWAGVHEFNIDKAVRLARRLGLPEVCTQEQWEQCDNKRFFKDMCVKFGIPVTKEFSYQNKEQIVYPVICKPTDSSGSRGFSICTNEAELDKGYQHALDFSASGNVLVEQYMPYDSVIIHYTFVKGKAVLSTISDKRSMLLDGGGSVMALQTFPAVHIDAYREALDAKAQDMFRALGITDGVAWIEAFDNNGEFTFNEMGLRLGGSLTNYPVKYFTGADQLELLIKKAVGDTYSLADIAQEGFKKYAILPLHIKSGEIAAIHGEDIVKAMEEVYAYVPVHFVGDVIEDWGSAQNVMCYLHILYDTFEELKNSIKNIINNLNVCGTKGEELLYCLYDIERLGCDR